MNVLKIPLAILAVSCFLACTKHSDNSNPQPERPALVVILGSSTAAGRGADPLDSAWAYRIQDVVNNNRLKAKFIDLAKLGLSTYEAMPNGYSVVNRPDPDTSANITKALKLKPNLVILSFPSNDIADDCSGIEIMHNYSVIVHMLDSAKVQYIIVGDQPRNFPTYNQRYREKTLNDTIKNTYGIHVNDIFGQLSTSSYMINPVYSAGDGIHLNNRGHAFIMSATLRQPIFVQVVRL